VSNRIHLPGIEHHGTGVSATGNSYVDLESCQIKSNTNGVVFDLFGKGLLRGTSFDGNGTDTAKSRGGDYYTQP
jgi:hypothetical protein